MVNEGVAPAKRLRAENVRPPVVTVAEMTQEDLQKLDLSLASLMESAADEAPRLNDAVTADMVVLPRKGEDRISALGMTLVGTFQTQTLGFRDHHSERMLRALAGGVYSLPVELDVQPPSEPFWHKPNKLPWVGGRETDTKE